MKHPQKDQHKFILKVIQDVKNERDGIKFAFNTPYTPFPLAYEIVKQISDHVSSESKVLVLFTIELGVALSNQGFTDITVATDKYCPVSEKISAKLGFTYMTIQDANSKSRKFDVVVGNPPYQGKAALHQQFFNKGVDLLVDGGSLAFIQPATTYFNKKAKQKNPVEVMIKNIQTYHTDVVFKRPEVFVGAGIQNDLSITFLRKTMSASPNIGTVVYKNGNRYTNVPIENISMTQLDPVVYESIRNKYLKYIEEHGCLEDLITRTPGELKASLGKIRGTRPTDSDFYTFIPLRENRFGYGPSLDSTFGVSIKQPHVAEYVYDYLESYVARFGLALLKFSQNTANKEFALVPLVQFDKFYDDSVLYSKLGLTDNEIIQIKQVIIPLYSRHEDLE